MRGHGAAYAQTTLAGLAVALMLVIAITVGGVAATDRVLTDTAGESFEQHRAESAADALLMKSPITRSDNGGDAVDLTLVSETNVTALAAAVPSLRGAAFHVRIDGRTVTERGDPPSGYTVSRNAVGISRWTVRRSINLLAEPSTTLIGRMNRTRLDVNLVPNITVQAIWVDDRVALHQPVRIGRQHVVGVSSRPDCEARAETTGDEPSGSVDVSATAFDATVVRIEVTMGA